MKATKSEAPEGTSVKREKTKESVNGGSGTNHRPKRRRSARQMEREAPTVIEVDGEDEEEKEDHDEHEHEKKEHEKKGKQEELDTVGGEKEEEPMHDVQAHGRATKREAPAPEVPAQYKQHVASKDWSFLYRPPRQGVASVPELSVDDLLRFINVHDLEPESKNRPRGAKKAPAADASVAPHPNNSSAAESAIPIAHSTQEGCSSVPAKPNHASAHTPPSLYNSLRLTNRNENGKDKNPQHEGNSTSDPNGKLELQGQQKRKKGNKDERKKRQRRTAKEIERNFKCEMPNCSRAYGSEGALKMHIRLKHPGARRGMRGIFQAARGVAPFVLSPFPFGISPVLLPTPPQQQSPLGSSGQTPPSTSTTLPQTVPPAKPMMYQPQLHPAPPSR